MMKGFNRWIQVSLVLVLMLSMAACTMLGAQTGQSPTPHIGKSALKPVVLESKKILAGQTIYVPVYSYIYHYDTQNQVINLATTLSIRNTDLKHPIIITKIEYYDTGGKLIKNILENPSELSSMASADYFLPRNEVSGGLGANFLVEWVAEHSIFEPIVEAVMVSTESGRGLSFVSPGKVLKRIEMKPVS
ncbi:DUF3124 domain-containing protein [Sivoneniella epilithica]